jgi:hypothetical protein
VKNACSWTVKLASRSIVFQKDIKKYMDYYAWITKVTRCYYKQVMSHAYMYLLWHDKMIVIFMFKIIIQITSIQATISNARGRRWYLTRVYCSPPCPWPYFPLYLTTIIMSCFQIKSTSVFTDHKAWNCSGVEQTSEKISGPRKCDKN